MSTVIKKMRRDWEKKRVSGLISAMLTEMGISRGVFERTMPKMSGSGFKYGISGDGGKASLRQKYSFLKGLYDFKMKEKEKKETENGETK